MCDLIRRIPEQVYMALSERQIKFYERTFGQTHINLNKDRSILSFSSFRSGIYDLSERQIKFYDRTFGQTHI